MKTRKFTFLFLSLFLFFALPLNACDDEESIDSSPQSSESGSTDIGDKNTESGTQGSDESQIPTPTPPNETPVLTESDVPVLTAQATNAVRAATQRLFSNVETQATVSTDSQETADANSQTAPRYEKTPLLQILPATLTLLRPLHTLEYIWQTVNGSQEYYRENYSLGSTVYTELEREDFPFPSVLAQTPTASPTLALRTEMGDGFIAFSLDYTLKAEEQTNSAYATVQAKIEYDHEEKRIGKIAVNTYLSQPCAYLTVVLNTQTEQAYLLESIGEEKSRTPDVQAFCSNFESGALDYRNSRKYPFFSTFAARWNTNENEKFSYVAFTKSNPLLQTQDVLQIIDTLEEQSFANIYNEAYDQAYTLPFRTENELLSLHGASQANYLNDATRYATNVSKCEMIDGKISFSFLDIEQMQTLLRSLFVYGDLQTDPTASALLTGAQNSLPFLQSHYVGELGAYGETSYALLRELPDEVLPLSNAPFATDLLIRLRARKYQLTDGDFAITFLLNDDRTVITDAAVEHTEDLTFRYEETDGSYAVCIDPETKRNEITIPAKRLLRPVTKIYGDLSFIGASPLAEITLPYTLTAMEQSAFAAFSNLKKVNFLGSLEAWVQIQFDGLTSSPTYFAKDLYIQGELVTNAEIKTATDIHAYAFANCTSLTKIALSDCVQTVHPNAFVGCINLTADDVYDNCYYISYGTVPYRFLLRAKEQTLTRVTLHENTQIVGYGAFENCARLEKAVWNENVRVIGERAFANCAVLENVTIGKGVQNVGKHAFLNCHAIAFEFEAQTGWFAYKKTDQSDLLSVDISELPILLTSAEYEYAYVRKDE